MIAQFTYEIKFLNQKGNVIKSLSFPNYSTCIHMYESLDTVNSHLVPVEATSVEWHMILIAAKPAPRRRSVISGKFKEGGV